MSALPRSPDRSAEPAGARGGTRTRGSRSHRCVLGAGGDLAPRRRPSVDVLDGHAAAAGRRNVPDRRPAVVDLGLADERPRSRGHAGDAGHDPLAGRRGTHGGVVLAPAGRGRADVRCGRDTSVFRPTL